MSQIDIVALSAKHERRNVGGDIQAHIEAWKNQPDAEKTFIRVVEILDEHGFSVLRKPK